MSHFCLVGILTQDQSPKLSHAVTHIYFPKIVTCTYEFSFKVHIILKRCGFWHVNFSNFQHVINMIFVFVIQM